MASFNKAKGGRGRGRGISRQVQDVNIFGQQKHNIESKPDCNSQGDTLFTGGKRNKERNSEKEIVLSDPALSWPLAEAQPLSEAEQEFSQQPALSESSVPSQRLPQEDESSSDDEVNDGIVDKMLLAYSGELGNNVDGVLSESRQNLEEACQLGSHDCSVCLSKIRRIDAVWTCDSCFTSLHLQCIQKWAKEGILQASLHTDDTVSVENLWSCPNCRTAYPQSQCPRQYTCFCKKVINPPAHPWLAPHTCGETCNRSLRPECGHKCLLLCHPGACPPCPQTVQTRCHCGRMGARLRRCSSRAWSCGQTCSKILLCGQHQCTQPCHPGKCPPCPRRSEQQCCCKRKVTERECASPTWHCGEVCRKPLSCGHHICERTCHVGACGDCPRMGIRTCPCGKTALQLKCTEDIPRCGDTCDKPLPCGVHRCTRRCHTGPCENCLQMSRKKCRCGAREKTIPCKDEFRCDHRCTNMKNCKKHQCKRRCCSGNCPPCEQQCNKNLPCGNHKCPSPCHPGRCFPCPLMVEVKCRCGHTKLSVRCGREKTVKPPKCKKPCKIAPDCHHPAREKHLCHFNKCPPCKLACNKKLPCGHICTKRCHDAVPHKHIEKKGQRAPWQPVPKSVISLVKEPCPPCQFPIPTQCLGKHEISDLPCHNAAPFSCKRPCGRLLPCTNHSCQFECHHVQGAQEKLKAGTNCEVCEEGCSQERREGCRHQCILPCHPGPCPPCKKNIKMRCHCKLMPLYVECNAWLNSTDKIREDLASCKGPCPRLLSCKHPCAKLCHSGSCSDTRECTSTVSRRCPCKRRKKDFLCHEIHCGKAIIECDDVCKQLKDKKLQQEEDKIRRDEQEQIEKEKRDLEEYNRLTNRKKKPRKRREIVQDETFWEKYGSYTMISSGVIVLIAFIVYLILQ